MNDGGYPAHRAEKDAAEDYVAAVVEAIGRGDAPDLAVEWQHYLRAMFPPGELQTVESDPDPFARQVGLAALQRALDEALYELEERSFEAPTPADPVFERCSSLLDRMTKDGLVRLQAGDVCDEALRCEGVFAVDGSAVYRTMSGSGRSYAPLRPRGAPRD